MVLFHLLRLVEVVLFSASFVLGQTCIYSECQCMDERIDCQERQLNRIPPVVGPRTGYESLDLGTNNITTVPVSQLPSDLSSISFLNNPITSINDNAFNESSETLKSLSFAGALFTRLPNALLKLHSLTSLEISDTNVLNWNLEVMRSLSQTLERLHLTNVSLTSWPSWLQNFNNLTELNLDSNQIAFIPENAFDALTHKLAILSMARNRLTAIPYAVYSLTSIIAVSFGFNMISDLRYLPHSATYLGVLSLVYNNITDARALSDSLRPLGKTLSSVSIFGNQLTEIPDLSFMLHMGYLDLSHNRIANTTSGSLPTQITDLVLQFNALPAIPRIYTTIRYVRSIKMANNLVTKLLASEIPVWTTELQLGENLITELSNASFPANSTLQTIFLMDNPLNRIWEHTFDNLHSLRTLALEKTQLTRMPLAFTAWTNVRLLDLTDCPALVCTCAEKTLRTWVESHHNFIHGNCGDTSIYDFFRLLSPACP